VSARHQIDDHQIGHPPGGQTQLFVSPAVHHDWQLLLLFDPDMLAARL
jgi:hypothetical protein